MNSVCKEESFLIDFWIPFAGSPLAVNGREHLLLHFSTFLSTVWGGGGHHFRLYIWMTPPSAVYNGAFSRRVLSGAGVCGWTRSGGLFHFQAADRSLEALDAEAA